VVQLFSVNRQFCPNSLILVTKQITRPYSLIFFLHAFSRENTELLQLCRGIREYHHGVSWDYQGDFVIAVRGNCAIAGWEAIGVRNANPVDVGVPGERLLRSVGEM
jgi:hypothetical protein